MREACVNSSKGPVHTSRARTLCLAALSLNLNYYSPLLMLKISEKLQPHHSVLLLSGG